RSMGGALFDEHLGGAAPDHHQPVTTVLRAEPADVGTQRFRPLPFGLAGDHVGALEPLHVALVEGSRHWLDRAKEVGDRGEVGVPVEHTGLECRRVGVVGNRVPGAEHQVVARGEGNELPDERRAARGTLAQPDGAELGEATDGPAEPATSELHAGDEGRRNRTETGQEHTQLALRRSWIGSRDRQGFVRDSEEILTRARVGRGRPTAAAAVWRYTQRMRWNAVKLVSTAIRINTQVSTAPSKDPPKISEDPPISTTRSNRCISPTLQSSPSDSARARV